MEVREDHRIQVLRRSHGQHRRRLRHHVRHQVVQLQLVQHQLARHRYVQRLIAPQRVVPSRRDALEGSRLGPVQAHHNVQHAPRRLVGEIHRSAKVVVVQWQLMRHRS